MYTYIRKREEHKNGTIKQPFGKPEQVKHSRKEDKTMKTYLINDETTTYIAILNGEGDYILDLFEDAVFNAGEIDPTEYDTEDYFEAVLKKAIERGDFDAGMCWTNRAGCFTEIGEAEDIEEVLEKEWWSKGYRASYTEI